MNCSDFTSSGGDKNCKRSYSAANRGARTEQHHNSSIDFLTFGSRCRKRYGGPNAKALTRIRTNVGCGTVVETEAVLAQCFGSRGLRQRLGRQHGCRESDRCPLKSRHHHTSRTTLGVSVAKAEYCYGVEETRQHIGNVLPIGARIRVFSDARNAGAPAAGSRRARARWSCSSRTTTGCARSAASMGY
jgi:hypothetical protein